MIYGHDKTIHGTRHLHVETRDGKVVAVWFRCVTLPFEQVEVGKDREKSMAACKPPYPLLAVHLDDGHDPKPGDKLSCLVCGYEKEWGIRQQESGVAVCVDCRDAARKANDNVAYLSVVLEQSVSALEGVVSALRRAISAIL